MPCLEIILPKLENETKESLSRELTSVFAEVTPFPAEIFGIHFSEYEPGTVALGGNLWNGGNGRPYLHFLLYSPRLKHEVKRQLVERLSKVFAEVVGHDDWLPVIHLCEHPYVNVGVEGKLLSDSYEACADAKFYYDLSDE